MLSNLSERIAMARRHVLTGRAAIERQRDVIAKKCGRDFDTSASEQLLVQFETSQAIFEDHWERLLREQLLEALQQRIYRTISETYGGLHSHLPLRVPTYLNRQKYNRPE